MVISLFSGQGSQFTGMGKEILEKHPDLSSMYDAASSIVGKDLLDLCLNADEETLSLTVNAQPAIMITSLAYLEAAKRKGFNFEGVGGHSLGEYAAMVASEIVSFEDGFRLIKARSEAMGKVASGSMAAVLKLSPEEVERVCSSIGGYVVPVNYNSPQQTVIAGETEAVSLALKEFTAMKSRVVYLKVSAAFHSALMQDAADEFYETAKTVAFNKPKVKYYSNVTGKRVTDFSDMPSLLAQHIVSPVLFTTELKSMTKSGFFTFAEFGPGKVLTGLVKKTLPDAFAYKYELKE